MCHDAHCRARQEHWRSRPMTAQSRRSTLPDAGNGLYADRAYAKGQRVAYYSGTYSDDRFLEGDRVLQLTARISVDGDGPCRSACNRGDLINHAPSQANCRFAWCTESPRRLRLAVVQTTRAVAPGEEFFIDYGPFFQF
jgi:hypothetical protein